VPVLKSVDRGKARMPYCPICKAEYRPGFRQCSDCLADLVDGLREAEAAKAVLLWEGLSLSKFDAIVAALRDANIPNRAKSAADPDRAYSFNPFVRMMAMKEQMSWQVFVLERDYERARIAAQSNL
jgi:hypothetical protein